MVSLVPLIFIAVVLQSWTAALTDSKHRRHQEDASHADGSYTHTAVNRSKGGLQGGGRSTHQHHSHAETAEDRHRGYRKLGALSKQVSLLQAAPHMLVDKTADGTTVTNPGSQTSYSQTLASASSTAAGVNVEPQGQTAAASNVAPTQGANQIAPVNGLANPEIAPDNAEENNGPTDFACKFLWFLFKECNKPAPATQDANAQSNAATDIADDQQPVPPVVSSSCTIYGTTVLSLDDFKDPEENGWILVNDSNAPRITHNKQVNLDKPAQLQLKATLCNAATYEATIKLGVDSSGGFIIRGSDQDFVVFEMNTLAKTATLKSINGAYQDIISEVACVSCCSLVNMRGRTKLTANLYRSERRNAAIFFRQIDILIDGRKITSTSRMPYKSSGYFGFYIAQGNATFGDLSVVPINE
ncbi:membrane protein, putative [Babesia bigemina]|uniref:Membrane protein, putative n=1 Tax=Babesia bigemina TaxID=5866 RepID=A0A061D107_BABBI|nr:membrane protein, putative [Babesia bigemina]CDR94506.1 membrane protein, putative [Babesia bigemina]|eukprot:XP_012766692.1 membrane protein, putative [Babesia bigemina]